MERYLSELREGLLRHAQGRRTDTAIARVSLSRGQATTGPLAGLYEPMLCLVVQGAKRVIVGDRVLDYDPGNCFVTAVEVPATGRIVEASRQRPYLAIGLVFEPAIVTELLAHLPGARDGDAGASFAVEPVSAALLDAWVRMIRLLDHPAEIPALAPLIEREILFRLLQGPHARVLRQIARGWPVVPDPARRRPHSHAVRSALAYRGTGGAGRHEPGDLSSPLQGGDDLGAAAIPEDRPAAAGAPAADDREPRRHRGGLRGRL